jgi:hypothetical protein
VDQAVIIAAIRAHLDPIISGMTVELETFRQKMEAENARMETRIRDLRNSLLPWMPVAGHC